LKESASSFCHAKAFVSWSRRQNEIKKK
jgi:hypothetical protein